MRCPRCRSTKIGKLGLIPTRQGKKQRYRCNECGSTFYDPKEQKAKGGK